MTPLEETPIAALGLSVRTAGALQRAGVKTLAELLQLSDQQLLSIYSLGQRGLDEIHRALLPFDQDRSPPSPPSADSDISTLHLSARAFNALDGAGIRRVSDLLPLSDEELLSILNLGQTSLDEIHGALLPFKEPDTLGEMCGISDSLLEYIGEYRVSSLLDLSVRARHCLSSAGIRTVRELLTWTGEELLHLRNFGTDSLSSVRRVLQRLANGDIDLVVAEMHVPLEKRGLPLALECLSRPIEDLELPDYLLDAFILGDIKEIRQLLALTEYELIDMTMDSHVLAILAASLTRWRSPPRSVREVFERCTETLSDRQKDIVSKRWGIFDGDRKTLEEMGQEYNLTRERIRQIEAKALIKLHRTRARRQGLEMVRHVVEIADSCTEIATSRLDLLKHLQEVGIGATDEELRMIQFFIDIGWVEVPAGLQIDMHSPFPVLRGKQQFAEVLRLALKHARNRGAAYLQAIAAELGFPVDECREILRGGPLVEASSDWFILPQALPPFLTNVRLMHAYCGDRLALRFIRSGLRKQAVRHAYYQGMPLPPSEVIGAALATLPEFHVGAGFVNWKRPEGLDAELELPGSTQVLISLFDAKGPVLSYPEIHQGILAAGLSTPTVSAVLRQSPLVRKLEFGLYARAGTDISWEQVQEARTRRASRVSAGSVLKYVRDGSIQLELNVGGFGVSGVISSSHLDRLDGRWGLATGGTAKGTLTIRNNFAYGLGPAFTALDVRTGDRIRLSFDVRERVVDIELVARAGNAN